MGKMYTLQPNESIHDHMKDSMDIINHIVELSISCMRDLANPHEGTFIDMTYNKFMRALEHIRETIQMLDELTDELEDREDEVRREYEERVIRFFNSWMNSDMSEEYKSRAEESARRIHEIENHYMSQIQQLNKELEDAILNRDANIELYTAEREHSNQLEKRCSALVRSRDDAVEYWTKHCEILLQKHREELATKDHEIWGLQEQVEYWEDLAKKYADPDGHKICNPNNPANFCGNCKHFEMHAGDVGVCARLKNQNKYKVVDPDDASCSHFKSNNGVVIGKPEFPCCNHCNHEDCDDCTLCPF